VVIRDEPDRQDPTRTRQRVAGWVPAGAVKQSDIPSDGGFEPVSPAVADDDIPFRWEGPQDYDAAKTHSSRW
jgi:hypothetical protein